MSTFRYDLDITKNGKIKHHKVFSSKRLCISELRKFMRRKGTIEVIRGPITSNSYGTYEKDNVTFLTGRAKLEASRQSACL